MSKTLLFMLFSTLPFLGNAAERLSVGDPLPSETCLNQDGTSLSITEYGSQGYLLVYFYPKANTPGCTKQGCSLRDSWEELTKRGVKVLGVSTDSVAAQKSFHTEQKFPFPLLSDSEKKVVTAFKVKTNFGFASRSAYLFRDGTCIMADYEGHTGDQAAEVIRFLQQKK